jgi:hypothetical protein
MLPRSILTVYNSVAGFAGAVADTPWFVQQQVPQKVPVPVTENSIVLAWQLGNIYLLLAFVAVALFTSTSEIKVIRRYLVALALGDVGHIGWTAYGLGMERMSKIGEINLMTWANIAPTVSPPSTASYFNLTIIRFSSWSFASLTLAASSGQTTRL